jgi:uncharacterized protein (DUF427 family)
MKRPKSVIRREHRGGQLGISLADPLYYSWTHFLSDFVRANRARGMPMSVTIRERESGTALAQSDVGPNLAKYEGNWYFDPAAVQADVLHVSERTYTCPYKGTCNWVDYIGPDGRTVRDVAWVYPKVKPGHELIEGRYGFYAGSRNATNEES